MVAVARQHHQYARGTLAALEREKEKKTTFIGIDHSPSIASQSLLKGVMHWLSASGTINIAPTSISLVDDYAELQAAHIRSEQMLEETRRKLAEAERKLVMLKQGTAGLVSLTKAAQMHGVNYSTMWRAHKDGRLKAVVIGGKEKDQLMCDPTTFRPAAKSKLNKLNPK